MSGQRPASIWDREHAAVSIGAIALIFLAAIEALAVTTVMPVVSAALDGEALYAVAFAGTLATGVIGMVACGAWSDARGPRHPLYAAVALFIAGLVISGTAFSMEIFLAGRLVQGLGGGGLTVALYVVVARLYPPHLHGRIFAAFAAAWVVPAMIGPFLAGAVAEYLDWRWAFLGVAVLTAVAFMAVLIRLHALDLGGGQADAAASVGRRLVLAVVVALAAVTVGLTADAPAEARWPIAVGAIVVIGFAITPLLPKGALRAKPGLPSVVLLRGLVAAAFFATEAYVPYLLMAEFGFSPTWAGIALMLSAFAWAGGSAVQGRYGESLGNRRLVIISLTLILIALLSALVCALTGASPMIVVLGWGFGGGGMGLLYPRLTVLTLAYSAPERTGFNSSALSIADSTGSAVAVAMAGLIVATVGGGVGAFPFVFLFTPALVLIALLPALRLGHGAEQG